MLSAFSVLFKIKLCSLLNNILLEVWSNLVSNIKGRAFTEGVWEQGAEENIWT
jgi:hypothetical protein